MRVLRRPILQRFLSVGLLFSLTMWLAVPVSGATLAAQAEGLGLPPDFEEVLGEALAGTRTAEGFAESLSTALAARPDGDALAALVEVEPGALFAFLYGHLFQAFGHFDGPLAVPAVYAGSATGSAPAAALAVMRVADRAGAPHPALRYGALDRVVLPVALLTAAQPLGP